MHNNACSSHRKEDECPVPCICLSNLRNGLLILHIDVLFAFYITNGELPSAMPKLFHVLPYWQPGQEQHLEYEPRSNGEIINIPSSIRQYLSTSTEKHFNLPNYTSEDNKKLRASRIMLGSGEDVNEPTSTKRDMSPTY